MEKKLSYGLMLSLKEISLRRLTVVLLSQTDILASFNAIGLNYKIEDEIKDNISKLELPPLLTEEMRHLLKPIGSEISTWIMFHRNFLKSYRGSFDVHILQQLCWTTFGTVDYAKTAEKLIHHGMLEDRISFQAACLYCLDDYIPFLWERLPEEIKIYFYRVEGYVEPQLEFSWPCILKGEETKLEWKLPGRTIGNPTTYNQYTFEYSALNGNKAATEYFFRRLTNNEREASLFRTAQAVVIHRNEIDSRFNRFPGEKFSDTFCYLLSLLSPEQQMEILKGQPRNTLRCLLDWPWQDIFLDIAELTWPFLTATDYIYILQEISKKIISGYSLTKSYQEFFLHIPNDFKKDFVKQECEFGFIFDMMRDDKNSEVLKVIFRNIDFEDKKSLVFSLPGFRFLRFSILQDKWPLVELYVNEATLSKGDKQELKKSFFNYIKTSLGISEYEEVEINLIGSKWQQLFFFLD